MIVGTADASLAYHYNENHILWLLVPLPPLWQTIILRIVLYDFWYRWLICDVPLYWGSYSLTFGTGDSSVTYHYIEDRILWLLVPVTPLWRTIILRIVFYDCWYRWRLYDVPLYWGLYSMTVGTGDASMTYHYTEDCIVWLLVPVIHLWRTIIMRIVFYDCWYRWRLCDVPLYWGLYSMTVGTGDASMTYHYTEACILWLLVQVTPLWRTIILRIVFYDCWYRWRTIILTNVYHNECLPENVSGL